jgi:PAS domain S-box-containing protein
VPQQTFVALAEGVRDYAIFLMNPEGVITFWGEGARLMKWWSKEQAEGSHLRFLYPEGGSEDGTAEEHLEECARTGEYSGEGTRVRSDDSTFWAGTTLTALRDEGGTLVGFAKVTRDLTARRAADALLQTAVDAAESARAAAVEANNAKSGFLATMSHEIRTPINAVIGYTDLLDVEIMGPLTAGQREYVGRVRSSARHLLGLVDEILDLSRLEAGRVVVRESAFRLGDAVDAACSLVEPQARARQVTVANAVSGLASELACWGDESRVRQILANLLVNAVKFTEAGGRVTVSAGTASDPSADARLPGAGPWAYVRVEDTGHGIAPERLTSIFEPFVQGDMALTRRHGGSGLGLTISRRLARLMSGDIVVRSTPGVGSEFVLWLPAATVESVRMRAERVHEQAEERGKDDGNMRPVPVGTLREVGRAILADTERVLHAYVARLRSDTRIPSAREADDTELEDHMSTFVADLAQNLSAVDLSDGLPTPTLRDGSDIQRLVADRHGAQRARLGWQADELRREHEILREELARVIRRRVPHGRRREAETAISVVDGWLAQAERLSLLGFEREVPGEQ